MKYVVLIYETEEELARREGPEAPAYWAAWTAYSAALTDAGVMRGGAGLQPPGTATTLRPARGGDHRQVQDGPFADTKEQLGGFYIIETRDLDAALKWASRCPSIAGTVEVRPVLGM